MVTTAIQLQQTQAITDTIIVEEARSWIRTPYLLGARLKGCGCDCCTFLIEVFVAVGLVKREEIDRELTLYSGDWFRHTTEERYLRTLLKFATKIMETRCYPSTIASPGSIVLTKAFGLSKRWNHGGIVTKWPKLIHAVGPEVCETDASRDPMWMFQEIGIYRIQGT